jgi:ATP-dependent DNA helicase RecG
MKSFSKESDCVEFKYSLAESKDIVKTVAAFSNTHGGNIYVGIQDDGTVLGVEIGKNSVEKLANSIKQNTDPCIYPLINVTTESGKTIMVITVSENASKPVFAFGRAYKRVGKTNQRIGQNEIRGLSLQSANMSWDRQICKGASLDDIDEEKVIWFVKKARFERNVTIDSNTPLKEVLERLKLMKDGDLCNASILLFAKHPSKFFNQAETRCARFKGTEPIDFIDMKVFNGSIIDQRENAVAFVKEHIKLHAKIIGTERVETWEYPLEAVREAITNAICHRDYEIASTVQIRIFDDRIEIWGVGPLPNPLTLKDLVKKHDSVLRNPLIANSLFMIKYIEQWGTGTNRIIEACIDHGLPQPLFEILSGSLVITFRKYKITEEMIQSLNDRQKKIIEYLKEHKKITSKECSQLFDISKRTARNDLNDLISKEIIQRKGKSDKKTYYVFSGNLAEI